MPDVRTSPSGDTPEEVLAREIVRLSADLADLRAIVLARTSGSTTTAHAVQASNAAATTSFTSVTWTALAWDTDDVDTDGFHSTSSNTSRITIPAGLGGLYAVRAQVGFYNQSPSADCHVAIFKNGAAITPAGATGQAETVAYGAKHTVTAHQTLRLAPGDYLEAFAYSSAAFPSYAGNLSYQSTSHFAAEHLGP